MRRFKITPNLCSFFRTGNEVSHPYKTEGIIKTILAKKKFRIGVLD